MNASWRRFLGEGRPEKVRDEGPAGEGLSDERWLEVSQRRLAEEDPLTNARPEKVH